MDKENDFNVRVFVNGQALSGGSMSFALEGATFLGQVKTAAHYKFYSVQDEFPGLFQVQDGGVKIPGELYEVSYTQLRDRLLSNEPAELELTVIELEDGSGSLSMCLRASAISPQTVVDITASGGWLAYLKNRQSKL